MHRALAVVLLVVVGCGSATSVTTSTGGGKWRRIPQQPPGLDFARCGPDFHQTGFGTVTLVPVEERKGAGHTPAHRAAHTGRFLVSVRPVLSQLAR